MAKINQNSPEDTSLNDAGQEIAKERQDFRAVLPALVGSLQRSGSIGAEELTGRVKDMVDALWRHLQANVGTHLSAWPVGARATGQRSDASAR